MAIKKQLLSLFVAAACVFPAFAQDAFDQVIGTIVASSPQVQSERDLARAVALDTYTLSNPEVSFSRVWGHKGVGNKWQLDVSQSFDWPGVYGALGKANASEESAAQALCLWTELDVALQAKQLLIELVYVRKQMAMYADIERNMQQLEQAVATAQEQGYATELDRRKIAIEHYKLSSQVAALDARQTQIEGELQAMNNGNTLDLSGIDAYPIEKILTLQEYNDQITSADPQLLAASLTVATRQYETKAAALQRLPSFSVGYEHQTELGDNFDGFTVSMTLPFFENRQAKGVAQARAEAADAQRLALVSQKRQALVSTMAEMQTWRERVDQYNAVFGDNAYLTLIKKAYDGGELSVIHYIGEVNYFAEATQAFLEAEYNFRSVLANLNKYNLIKEQ